MSIYGKALDYYNHLVHQGIGVRRAEDHVLQRFGFTVLDALDAILTVAA